MPESLLIVESETIDEFCKKEKISRSFYFQMQREGWGPDEASLGRLKRITPESHQRWRRQRERAAALGIRGALPASELSP
jgi:hypothetical protein